MKQQRSYALDLIKLLLSYVIAFFHCGLSVSPGPTVTVQVFFILSGFFLGKTFYEKQSESYSAWDYTLDHARKIYPYYFFSCAVFFLYVFARDAVSLALSPSLSGLGALIRSIYNQIPDLLLLQSSMFFHDSVNYPLWQLSALLIAGYFVFALLRQKEALARTVLFPAAILMIQSLLWSGVDLWENWGPFYIPLLRAFSPLCIGVLTYCFSTTAVYNRLRSHRRTFDILGLLCLVSLFAYADYRNIFLMTTPVWLLSCLDPESLLCRILNRPCFRRAGKLSLAIYCNHAFVIRILTALLIPRLEGAGVSVPDMMKGGMLFVLLTAYSLLTLWLVPKIFPVNRRSSS